MAQSVIGALRVNLGLDSAQFQRGMSQVQKDLATARTKFVAFSGAAAAVAAALGGLTIAVSETAAEVSRLAQVANTTPATLQKWSAGAKSVGIEQEKLSDILKDVNDRVGDFLTTGGGPMADFFEKIAPQVGVTADAFRDLSGPDALQLFVSSLEKANLSQAEMTFYMEAMASDSTLLLPLLRDNGRQMGILGDNAANLGSVMSNSTVLALRDANLASKDVSAAFAGMTNRIAGALAPSLEALATSFANSMREGGRLRVITDALIENMDRLGSIIAVAASYLGGRYVVALVAATRGTLTLAGALTTLKRAIASTGIGLLIVGLGELGSRMLFARDKTVEFEDGLYFAEGAQRSLNNALDVFQKTAAPSAGAQAIALARNLITEAEAAYEAAQAQRELALARVADLSASSNPTQRVRGANSAQREADEAGARAERALQAIDESRARLKRVATEVANAVSVTGSVVDPVVVERAEVATRSLGGAVAGLPAELNEAEAAADELAQAFSNGLQGAVTTVSDAFSDFIMSGLRDFKSFASSILDTFKQMIARMIATAASNKIMIGLGIGGTAASGGGFMGGGTGGLINSALGGVGGLSGLGSAVMGGASFLGSGIASGFASGGIGGAISGGASAFATAMGGATAGLGGAAAALGAAIPVIGAVALAFAAFKTKTKTLDSGLKVAVNGLDVVAQTFKKVEKSRFFGLSKSTKTTFKNDPNNPLVGAIGEIQTGISEAARVLGVGGDVFRNFSYDFQLSLRGLTQEQKLAKINEELASMGDEFAMLVPNIESMNQLLEQANQIGQSIRALTNRQDLFATSQDAIFAASSQARQQEVSAFQATPDLIRELITAVRQGDVNASRLTAQLVAIEQRRDLEPAA